MNDSEQTRLLIVGEVREVEKDLAAFREALSRIHGRIEELEPDRKEKLLNWAGTQVVTNGLILAIVRCEGLLEDYRHALERIDLPNNVITLEKSDAENK